MIELRKFVTRLMIKIALLKERSKLVCFIIPYSQIHVCCGDLKPYLFINNLNAL